MQEHADGYAKHGAVRSGPDANVEKNHITPRKSRFYGEEKNKHVRKGQLRRES